MVEIRPYIESDREILRDILKNEASYTKKGGRNAGRRECLCFMYSDYYFDYEPQNVLVAVEDGAVCGFIVASTDSELFQRKMHEVYIPKIRKYSLIWSLFHLVCLMVNHRQDVKGGAAFHINIANGHQGKGIGRMLMSAMGERVAAQGKKYLYLVTENKHTAGYKFYKRIGFRVKIRYPGGSMMLTREV